MMRRAAAGIGLVGVVGCMQGPPVVAPVIAAPPAAAPGGGPTRDVLPSALLARAPGDAEVLLRLSVARDHPLGPRLEPFVLAWPGWGATIRRVTSHPLADLDWIDIVGPKDAAKERMAARTTTDDAALDGRLASNGDGSLRLVVRGQPHLVAAAPPDGADALQVALRGSRVVDPPADDSEGLRAELPHPHVFFHVVPDEARRAILHVQARPEGAAEARLELSCDDPASAERVAGEMRDQANQVNGAVVKLLTRDLLGGLTVEIDGATAKLHLPASREQLEALATLAAGMIPPEPSP
jgi:hypothetical protein